MRSWQFIIVYMQQIIRHTYACTKYNAFYSIVYAADIICISEGMSELLRTKGNGLIYLPTSVTKGR